MAAESQSLLPDPLGQGVSVAGNVDLTHENAKFIARVRQMYAAMPPDIRAAVKVISGYRSPEQQAEIYQRHVAEYGSGSVYGHQAARPGLSMHNKGLAMDLQFTTPEAQKWAYDNASSYGLHFPVPGDIGHIEPVDAHPAYQMAVRSPATNPTGAVTTQSQAPLRASPPESPLLDTNLRQLLSQPAPPNPGTAAPVPAATAPQARPAAPLDMPHVSPGDQAGAYKTALQKILSGASANPFASNA